MRTATSDPEKLEMHLLKWGIQGQLWGRNQYFSVWGILSVNVGTEISSRQLEIWFWNSGARSELNTCLFIYISIYMVFKAIRLNGIPK